MKKTTNEINKVPVPPAPRDSAAMFSEAAFLDLQAATSAPALWKSMERLMMRILPAHNLQLYLHAPDLGRPQALFSTGGFLEGLAPEVLQKAASSTLIIPYVIANPGVRVLTLQNFFRNEAEFFEDPYYANFFEPFGWRYWMGIPFWNGALIGFLVILRKPEQGDFTEEELKAARKIYPHLNIAVRRVLQSHGEHSIRLSQQHLLRDINLPMVMLNWNNEIVFATRSARELLLNWQHGPQASRTYRLDHDVRLPEEIQTTVRRVRTTFINHLRLGETTPAIKPEQILHPTQRQLSAQVRLLFSGSTLMALPTILVELREQSATANGAPAGNGSGSLLSKREQELVGLICRGLSNAEIAAELGKTVGTVKQQLSALYGTLQVRSRSQLMAQFR